MTIADSPATAARRPATAWPLENALFSAAMIAQRLPWTDAPARALGLDALTRGGVTRLLLAHLRRTRSGRPVALSTPYGSFLVPLTPGDTEGLLTRADEAGALGPASGLTAGGQRYGLSPHAPLDREAAVAPAADAPASAAMDALLAEDVDRAIAARRGDGTLEWHAWYRDMLRLSRRVVAGAGAAPDTLLSEVIAVTTAAAGDRSYGAGSAALRRRLELHLADPDPESLAGRVMARGADADAAAPALAHALALVSEAAAGTALQALALLAAGAAVSPGDAVGEALRRYPPLAAAVYPVRAPFVWEDLAIAAGTEILRAPGWLRRPGDSDGTVPDPIPSALCGDPAGCAAARFAAVVAEAVVRVVTARVRPVLIAPACAAARLPDTLDPRTLLVALQDLADPGVHEDHRGRAGDGRVTVGTPTAVPVSAYGYAPASYGALAHASADRLERHAESLAACAGNSGWNGDETGERFRMALLGHAERCAEAADDVRRAAKRLSD
ncbi:hypothetical protein BCL76_104401 [Streptomyces sp. CG 926]|uniref:hypothetical protein n=1 Tax=Streptomyces sp. CG 926 TaxID=1882405 RepID=UPI000D6ACCC3|nr:hypothetical protein [Streptomyces sp. CG 926]PWK71295.1 hypothetical protein BCL76_104401 [Streptomyces sp. CG 926]